VLLGSSHIEKFKSIKYLGVTLCGGKTLSFECNIVKTELFCSMQLRLCSRQTTIDELKHVSLQENYCLPILTYASAAIKYSVKQVDELNACWNSVFRRIFGFQKYESVKSFICGLGRFDLRHIIRIRRAKFYFHVLWANHRLLKAGPD
jgi:hypothetical protein